MTQREIAVLKLRELGMYPMGVPDEIVESYIAVHKAIESKRSCGKCDLPTKVFPPRAEKGVLRCKHIGGLIAPEDFFCADFTPKENSDDT